jgi:hypothetical protein
VHDLETTYTLNHTILLSLFNSTAHHGVYRRPGRCKEWRTSFSHSQVFFFLCVRLAFSRFNNTSMTLARENWTLVLVNDVFIFRRVPLFKM